MSGKPAQGGVLGGLVHAAPEEIMLFASARMRRKFCETNSVQSKVRFKAGLSEIDFIDSNAFLKVLQI